MNPSIREVSLTDAYQMLMAIPSDDRDTWVQMGMVLKSEFGDSAFGIWDQWSQSSASYNQRDARAVWKSIKEASSSGKSSPTIASLIYQAKSYGWRPDTFNPPAQIATKAPEKPPETPERSTTAYAKRLYLASVREDKAVGNHPYAKAKGIEWAAGAGRAKASGRVIGKDADCIIIPIYHNASGKVQGVQAINHEGKKQTFGQITGGCLVLGNTLDRHIEWYVCEGWASAVSVVFHHRNGNAVCGVAFGKTNMETTAELMNSIFDPAEIVILEER